MTKFYLSIMAAIFSSIQLGCGLTLDIASLTHELDLNQCSHLIESANLNCKATALNLVTTYRLANDNTCTFVSVDPTSGEISGTPTIMDSGSCTLSIEATREQTIYKGKKEISISPKAPLQIGGLVSGANLASFQTARSIKLSPNQSQVAFTIADSDQKKTLMLANTNSTNLLRLTPSDVSVASFRFNPQSNKIFFSTDNWELFSINLDGNQLRKISSTSERVSIFNISSSGDFIVYHDSISGQIFKTSSDGSFKTGLLQQTRSLNTNYGRLEILNNSHVLFFSSIASGVNALFSVPLNGSGEFLLHPNLVSSGSVSSYLVTKNMQKIVFFGDVQTDEKFELYSVNFDGSNFTKLNPALGATADVREEYAVSDDSSKVVYYANYSSLSNIDLYSVNIDGTNNTKLTPALGSGQNAQAGIYYNCYFTEMKLCNVRFAPDSSKVIYISDQDTDNIMELYAVNTDGSNNHKISGSSVVGTSIAYFKISSDSNYVLFIGDMLVNNQNGLYFSKMDGSLRTRLDPTTTAFGWSDTLIAISPNNQTIFTQLQQSSAIGRETLSINTTSATQTPLLRGEGTSFHTAVQSEDNQLVYSILEINGSLQLVKYNFNNLALEVIANISPTIIADSYLSFLGNSYKEIVYDENLENIAFQNQSTISNKIDLWSFNTTTTSTINFFSSSPYQRVYLQEFWEVPKKFIFSDESDLRSAKPDGSDLTTLNQVSGGGGAYSIEKLKSGKLAFLNDDLLYTPELFTINADGTNYTRINGPGATQTYNVRMFRVTPNENRLIYSTTESGVAKVISSSIDGSSKITLNNTEPGATSSRDHFLVSPDSTQIAWSVYSASGPYVYTAPIDGTMPPFKIGDLQLAGSYSDPKFKWHPDSRRLIVASNFLEMTKSELFISSSDLTTYTKISPEMRSGGTITDFGVSPNGRWIYMITDAEVTNKFDLYIYDTEKKLLNKVSTTLSFFSATLGNSVQISPDSEYIVFIARENGSNSDEIFSINLSRLTLTKLNSALPVGAAVDKKIRIGSGCRVLYTSDELQAGVQSLFSVACTGYGKQKIDSYTQMGSGIRFFEYKVENNYGFYIGRSNSLIQHEIKRFSF